ncbi:MAG TPA: S46 family peptidase [Candidatus Avirikenella pullistercoris]|nr:S46 family peptidase [Candidatus Avirikenella pullistercoris]
MRIRRNIVVALLALFSLQSYAEEGMWLPSLIGQTKLKDMQAKGLKLTAEDLYSINQASLKDAIVTLGGCTGEMISGEGLFITNHHCGYGNIQSHSTVEHDYLTNGFWAANKQEELPNPGYTASFLVKMEDVTEDVLKGVKPDMDEAKKDEVIAKNKESIIARATKNNGYNARIEALYYANQYFLFVFEKFEDVRLVAAPPSAIGKFGGDTDNWMWPRHTGDFCLFRIYADKDNKPAKYSPDNVPYKPKKFFTISTKGVKEGDFTFIYGYPGRTSEYIVSDAVKYIAEEGNPHKIKLRTIRLDIMNRYQAKDPVVRIQYAAKNAGVANKWKKMQGEAKGIEKLGVVAEKQELENRFQEWAAGKPEYENLLPQFRELYAEVRPLDFAFDYYTEGFNGIELMSFAANFASLDASLTKEKAAALKERVKTFYKNYYQPIDQESAKALMAEFVKNVPAEFQPAVLKENAGNLDNWIDGLFTETILLDSSKVYRILDGDPSEIAGAMANDIAVQVNKSFVDFYKENVIGKRDVLNSRIEKLYTAYMKGLMEMQPDHVFYPDANSTLRIAYGKVDGFNPSDAVRYKCYSTLEGIMEKDNPEIYDYNVPQRLRDLYEAKDYGRWEVNGTVPVAFIATNHTTGGNSGSPVINGNGELIGVNFDRCWESTMSDIKYDSDLCRNIAVDIRYVLFLIDKYAGANYLIEEMKLN